MMGASIMDDFHAAVARSLQASRGVVRATAALRSEIRCGDRVERAGEALRAIFGKPTSLPLDMELLLVRMNDDEQR